MSSSSLHLAAILSMLVDHCAVVFFHNEMYLRGIGRFALPLFCFCLVVGFLNMKPEKRTHRSIQLYLLAIVSEFAFDFFQYGFSFSLYPQRQNIIWALLAGYLLMSVLERCKVRRQMEIAFGVLMGGSVLMLFLPSSYGVWCVFVILFLYLSLKHLRLSSLKKWQQDLFYLFSWPVICLVQYLMSGYLLTDLAEADLVCLAFYCIVPVFFVLYNGKRGYHSTALSVFNKSFYPLHLLVLGIFRMLL